MILLVAVMAATHILNMLMSTCPVDRIHARNTASTIQGILTPIIILPIVIQNHLAQQCGHPSLSRVTISWTNNRFHPTVTTKKRRTIPLSVPRWSARQMVDGEAIASESRNAVTVTTTAVAQGGEPQCFKRNRLI